MSIIHQGMLHDWQESQIWQALKRSATTESGDVCTTLQKWMPMIQGVLANAGTSPTDFTLHDSQHAFRVAEQMVALIPSATFMSLSVYELALLLLSAYLHDIGMSPKQNLVTLHFNLALTGLQGELSDDQSGEFEDWLKSNDFDIDVPLTNNSAPTADQLGSAAHIVAQYCRSQHVRWSEEWIEENLKNESLGTYMQWVDDLKRLCRSHHQGFPDLIIPAFDPKAAGSPGHVVHLRYLAAVLRIADILEFDPERTPEIIFRHRSVDPRSAIYWHRDHHLTKVVNDRMLTISASPPDAKIHRAIEEMIDDIEQELSMVRRLDDSYPFQYAQFQKTPLPHKWIIRPDVRRIVRPLNDSYEYIDGSFRPNTRKLLGLLSGTQLYESRLQGIREILQNAFDAVRESIAYDRLQRPSPADPKWEGVFASIHKVELQLAEKDGALWLSCIDDGIGMSKRILTDYFLVSGVSRRGELWRLERECQAAGFQLGCTAQFGIGVLSYFMVADQVQVFTRRSDLATDADNEGWFFETDGIGSFGELRRVPSWRRGTEVRLRLGREFIEEAVQRSSPSRAARAASGPAVGSTEDAVFKTVSAYLEEVLLYPPCNVAFVDNSRGNSLKTQSFAHGWRIDASLAPALPQDDAYELHAIGLPQLQQIENTMTRTYYTGNLPDNIGHYHFSIPRFNLESGPSHTYCIPDISGEHTLLHKMNFNDDYFYVPRGRNRLGWRGMSLGRSLFDDVVVASNVSAQVNFTDPSAGEVSVTRGRLQLSEQGNAALTWLSGVVDEKILEEAATFQGTSPFAMTSYYLASAVRAMPNDLKRTWLGVTDESLGQARWGDVRLPAMLAPQTDADEALRRNIKYRWRGQQLTRVVPGIHGLGPWIGNQIPPTKVLGVMMLGLRFPVAIWDHWLDPEASDYLNLGIKCEFPPSWKDFLRVEVGGGGLFHDGFVLWNQEQFPGRVQGTEVAGWLRSRFPDSPSREKFSSDDVFKYLQEPANIREILDKQAYAAAVLSLLASKDFQLLERLYQEMPNFVGSLWKAIESHAETSRLLCFTQDEVWCLTDKAISREKQYYPSDLSLPDPGPEWMIS